MADIAQIGANNAITIDGGFAIKLLSAAALTKGEVVYIDQAGADGVATVAPLDSDMPVGVVFNTVNGAGQEVWVVISGFAYVLPTAGVMAARGNIIYCSGTTAGRIDQATSLPAVAAHNREIGHFIENGSGNGVAAKAILHFN